MPEETGTGEAAASVARSVLTNAVPAAVPSTQSWPPDALANVEAPREDEQPADDETQALND